MRRVALIGVCCAACLLTGCRVAQSTLQGSGPASARISHLSWFMTILFLIITLIMWALISWGFYRRRGTLAEHAPVDIGGGHIWIAIGGVAIPLIILTVLFVLGLNLLTDFPIHGMRGGMHGDTAYAQTMMKPEIRIIGHQWWWEVQYLNDDVSKQFITANEIHLPAHRPVNIEVETRDVMHSFWIPALHGKVDLIPGHTNYIRIEASEAGSYTGQCAEYCGVQHSHMRLLAIAQEPEDYEAWLATQREPGHEPQTDDAKAGQQTFLAGPCSMCHTVRGTGAGGSVAPDLTHIGSRRYLAANSIPNNDAYLEAWITHAQSLKPGAQMPDLTQFSGEQLHDLVAYLRQLQ
jgi:cytochrome c oxidase subunit 2